MSVDENAVRPIGKGEATALAGKKKSTPEGLLAYRQSERDRYERRKQLGSRKLVKDMSTREHRMQMRKWRKWKSDSIRRHRENEQLPNVASTPTVETPEIQSSTVSSGAKLRGRKKVRKNRAKAYRTIEKLTEEVKQKDKLIQRYRQQLPVHRSNKKNDLGSKSTPRSVTQKQLSGCRVNDKVRKCLLFHNVLMSEIRDGVSRAGNKRALAQFVSGKLLKKYRVMHMTKVFGCSRRLLQLNRSKRMKRKSAVSSELIRHIQQFYLREDNSSSTAGKKETITRKKVKKQVHILKDICKNLHKKYLSENELSTVSYATFLRLRPFWVVSQSVEKRNTCLCKTCDNLQLKVNVLLKEKVINSPKLQHLASAFCCSTDSVQCMFGLCSVCSASKYPVHTDVFDLSTDVDISRPISWNEWTSSTEKRKQIKSNGEVKEFEVKVMKRVEVCSNLVDCLILSKMTCAIKVADICIQ